MDIKPEKIEITKIKENPKNPRVIRDDKFNKLVDSIKSFPEMLEVRPIVVDGDMIVLGGNMRLKACKKAGIEEVWIINADFLTPEQKKKFIIKDNVNYGNWDYELLDDYTTLKEWGMDLPEWTLNDEEDVDDDFFNDEFYKSINEAKDNYVDGVVEGASNITNLTFLMLWLPEEDYNLIKMNEEKLLRTTNTDNLSDAIFEIIKKY